MCYLNSRKILVIVFLSIVLCRVFESFCSTSNLSLSARFSDVVIENLDIGETYNISQMKGLPLTIINGSDIETQIIVEVDVPNPSELKEDYEAIPDPTWMKILPDQFVLPAAGRNLSDMLISIPNDPKLIGRHFQVMFWAHTLKTGFLGVGVRLRIRFSIGASSPESLKEELKSKRLVNLSFRLDPTSIGLSNISVGRVIDLQKEKHASIKLVNTGTEALKIKVASTEYLRPQQPPTGYEAIPDPRWIEVSPSIIKSKPDTITVLKIKLKVPDLPEYRGKKYAGILNASLVDEDIPVNVYSQILFTTSDVEKIDMKK